MKQKLKQNVVRISGTGFYRHMISNALFVVVMFGLVIPVGVEAAHIKVAVGWSRPGRKRDSFLLQCDSLLQETNDLLMDR